MSPLHDASPVLYECVLHGAQQTSRVVGLFNDRRVRKYFRVYVVNAHAGQKYKRRALRLKQGRNVEAVALRITQLHIKYRNVKFRLAAEQRDSFGCRGNACHVRRAGAFEDLLNVEGDQKLVVQHEAALAGKQAIRHRQGASLQMEPFLVLRI
ncbi:MAG: hypothetical protein WB769_19180 [Pseudolabrys sp.]